MVDDLISIADAAKVLQRHKHSLFKVINRLNINKVLIKSEESRGQRAAHISNKDFDILKTHLDGTSSSPVEQENDGSSGGYFYIIQLEPEFDRQRLKLGFATSVDERIRKHKTTAPFSTVIGNWPCKLLWEKTVIDYLTENCEKVYTEVFRVEDVEEIVRKAEAFFEMMPDPFPE
jgi:hypothetical protein